MSTTLPTGLEPWSASLAFLTADAATMLGPLIRRLDAIVRRHDGTVEAHEGEPDGYSGLTTRGIPERLLLSEWLLADEVPIEFLRRAATREQLHVAPQRTAPAPRGRVAVLFDVGPDQLGACRLVQLAALVVLHRRARERGVELAVGLSGEPIERWWTGALPGLFAACRAATTTMPPQPGEAASRAGTLEADDELWVFAGAGLAAAEPDRPLLVRTTEGRWREDGVAEVVLRFEGRTSVLPVPAGPAGARILRGSAVRRVADPTASGADGASARAPVFPGLNRRLVMRGESADTLLTLSIPTSRGGGAGRVKLHRLPGPVLAAAPLGRRRIVALVDVDGGAEVATIGAEVGGLRGLRVPLAELLPAGSAEAHAPLAPLFYDRGALLVRLDGVWWALRSGHEPEERTDLHAVAWGSAPDLPWRVTRRNDQLWVENRDEIISLADGEPEVVCGHRVVAFREDAAWTVVTRQAEALRRTIAVPDDETVLAVHQDHDGPSLVTRSDAGVLIRVRRPGGARTLTACSGLARSHSAHPRLPLLAIERDDGRIEVRDLGDGELLTEVAP